jgi:hypothetical protein
MKYVLPLFLTILLSCKGPIQTNEESTSDSIAIKYYSQKIKKNDFSLKRVGPCPDATEDTIYKYRVGYIQKKEVVGKKLEIDFILKEGCCQTFMGEYMINNDSLFFFYENVNNVICGCMCFYKYRLTLPKPEEEINYYSIRPK